MEVTERIGRCEISFRAKTPAQVLALMQTVDAYRAGKKDPLDRAGMPGDRLCPKCQHFTTIHDAAGVCSCGWCVCSKPEAP